MAVLLHQFRVCQGLGFRVLGRVYETFNTATTLLTKRNHLGGCRVGGCWSVRAKDWFAAVIRDPKGA